ncbi:MAG: polysaccharide deacetylase [Clostridia bacterium]|nr:polysaccharide deacetylase [Clostridia bacterium]
MQKRYIPIAVFFVVLLMILAHVSGRALAVPASFTYAEGKEVYLTFDDGPSNSVTVPILDTLKEENVKATFFIVSDRAHGREDILKRMASEGHTLGVHSASHDYQKIYASEEALLKDIDTCAAFIKKTTGITPTVYRFPGGGFKNKEKRALVKAHGYRIVDWNAVCGDEEIQSASAETLLKTTIDTSKGKAKVVLLMHDSAPRKATAAALKDIISYYKEQGYTFRTY